MLSKQQIKDINRLKQKKYRYQEGLFIVEGIKSIKDFLKSDYRLHTLYSTVDLFSTKDENCEIISEKDLARISSYKKPQVGLGVFRIMDEPMPKPSKLSLILSDINDPGNLGTLIRLCDWFGIRNIYCSKKTVDPYNPKVVQASMGSLSRVKLFYTDLKSLMKKQELPVYGAVMDGEPIYGKNLPENALLVIGNEANGIADELYPNIDHRISIPQFTSSHGAESLNAAMAGSILISEFRRRSFKG